MAYAFGALLCPNRGFRSQSQGQGLDMDDLTPRRQAAADAAASKTQRILELTQRPSVFRQAKESGGGGGGGRKKRDPSPRQNRTAQRERRDRPMTQSRGVQSTMASASFWPSFLRSGPHHHRHRSAGSRGLHHAAQNFLLIGVRFWLCCVQIGSVGPSRSTSESRGFQLDQSSSSGPSRAVQQDLYLDETHAVPTRDTPFQVRQAPAPVQQVGMPPAPSPSPAPEVAALSQSLRGLEFKLDAITTGMQLQKGVTDIASKLESLSQQVTIAQQQPAPEPEPKPEYTSDFDINLAHHT